MSAIEIIEQIKTLPLIEKKVVKDYLDQNVNDSMEGRLYDDFTVLGNDASSSDVAFAQAAQSEVVRHG